MSKTIFATHTCAACERERAPLGPVPLQVGGGPNKKRASIIAHQPRSLF
jgi:hypothetical protein